MITWLDISNEERARINAMIMEELKDLDPELVDEVHDWYYEPETDTVRSESPGMAYTGDSQDPVQMEQTESGEII